MCQCQRIYRDISQNKKIFYIKKDNGQLKLKKNHDYYYQIQGQLEMNGLNFCDFVVFREVDLYIERIYRSKSFWKEKMFEKLKNFFFLSYLSELTF